MKFSLCLIFILVSLGLYGQSDSTLKFSSALGLNITGGNFLSYTANINSELNKEFKKSQLNWSPNFQYSQVLSDNQFQLKEFEIYSNFNFVQSIKSFKFYLNNEIEHSYLQKVDLRSSLGFGFGHIIYKKDSFQSDISEFMMPEFMMSSFGNLYDNFAIRSSTRLKIKWIKNNSKISFIVFFQPSLFTFKGIDNQLIRVPFNDNVNFRSNLTAETKISKLYSIGIGNILVFQSYSNSVDKSVKPLDYTIYLFLKLN